MGLGYLSIFCYIRVILFIWSQNHPARPRGGIMQGTPKTIAASFKEKYTECPFLISTIICEFHENGVALNSRDL